MMLKQEDLIKDQIKKIKNGYYGEMNDFLKDQLTILEAGGIVKYCSKKVGWIK